jgi:hypothetical protein
MSSVAACPVAVRDRTHVLKNLHQRFWFANPILISFIIVVVMQFLYSETGFDHTTPYSSGDRVGTNKSCVFEDMAGTEKKALDI